jgi:UDPglucose 6-dehydrogenase
MNNISIIGSGYIGLVIGITLADLGHKIILADIDLEKINKLNSGQIPIYEPNLQELLNKNLANNNIQFTNDISLSIKSSSIIFIAVNTPTGKDDRADISAVKNVSEVIAQNLNEDKIICIKSTVPIGTHKIVEDIIKSINRKYNFEVVSIPEFLREGSALKDFINPDRIIIGTKSENAYKILRNIFLSTNCEPDKIIWTDNMSAETIKYVSNSFLALKVSFINEIANFCDEIGVDVIEVANGVGLDNRIGNQFLKPGPGFGGSCFPKDVLALLKMSQDFGCDLELIKATISINNSQKKRVIKKLKKLLNNDLLGKTIAILGLSFKANTDDIRCSPSIDIIKDLADENAIIKAYDPQAMQNMKEIFPDIIYCNNSYQAANNADAILLLTDWEEFSNLDLNKIYNLMNKKIILDTRNILNLDKLKKLGFIFETIGRSIASKNCSKVVCQKNINAHFTQL